jgi:hypothetical protein
MRNLLTGFLLALTLFFGYDYFYTRFYGRAAAVYLFSETEVQGKDGKPLSRADLINLMILSAAQRQK